MTAGDHVDRFVAAPSDEGIRLDVFLAGKLPALSRARIQQLIRTGHVVMDGRPAKPGNRLLPGAALDVRIPALEPAEPRPEALPVPIVYQDADVAVIDKPAGLVVHPGAGRRTGTLVNALLYHLRDLSGVGGVERPGIVHRLDRGTSGLMVVAKHDRAHRDLSRQFQERSVDKEYLALVWGTPRAGLTLDQPIGRDPRQRIRMSSRASKARAAVTRIIDVEPLGGVSLVRLAIGTGRTHQIRVHMSESGHAVVGDDLYGGARRPAGSDRAALASLDRPFLHAAHLAFTHPVTGQRLAFDAPVPADLDAVLARLRGRA